MSESVCLCVCEPAPNPTHCHRKAPGEKFPCINVSQLYHTSLHVSGGISSIDQTLKCLPMDCTRSTSPTAVVSSSLQG